MKKFFALIILLGIHSSIALSKDWDQTQKYFNKNLTATSASRPASASTELPDQLLEKKRARTPSSDSSFICRYSFGNEVSVAIELRRHCHSERSFSVIPLGMGQEGKDRFFWCCISKFDQSF